MKPEEVPKTEQNGRNNKVIFIVSVIVISILIIIFYFFLPEGIFSSRYLEPLNIGVYEGEFSSLILIADEEGYFKDEGLDVTLTFYDNGVDPLKNVINNNHDISTCGEFVAVSHIFDNPNLRILTSIQKGDAIELVAKKDSGIDLFTDLQGKKIGLKKKSQAEFFTGLVLESNSINAEVVDMNPGDMQAALDNDEINAVMVWDPFAYNIKQKLGEENNVRWWSGQQGQDFHFLIMTREDVISEKEGILRKFLKALIKAEERIVQNEAASKEVVQEVLDYESNYLDAVWSKSEFVVSLDAELVEIMKTEGEWAISHGLTSSTEVPNYRDYISEQTLVVLDSERSTL